MCMHVFTYTYTHVHTHIHIHIHTHISIYIYIHTYILYLKISISPAGPFNFHLFFNFLIFFQLLTPRDPKNFNLQVEIYISTKRRQNPMEFRWFRDRFSFFRKRRVGPTPISRFSAYMCVCIYIYIYMYIYIFTYIYMYINK